MDGTINNESGPQKPFNLALQTWTEIDLPTLQKKLDDQGLELKDDQKASLLSRKNLAAKTKDFKKLSDEERLDQFNKLLKLYQNEIDSLTNKKKSVENYFFSIYRVLAEAPDPRPLLEASLDAVVQSSEAEDLKEKINKLTEELTKKADYDQLKQRHLRSEQKAAELLSSKLKAKEDELQSLIEEKESNWTEKEKQFQHQLKEAQKKIEELRTSNEVTELQLNSQNRQQQDTTSASVLAELDIVSRDAESSKKRIFELEKRNEQLRRDLSKLQNDSEIEAIKEESSKKLSELEGENALLVAHLDQTRGKLSTITKEKTSTIETYTREVNQLSTEIKNLKTRLEDSSDYDEIKHELQLMRQIEFGVDLDDGGPADGEEGEEGTNQKIDSILIQRNKALTQELAEFRSEHDGLNSKIQALETNLESSTTELTKLQLLNDKLEEDLTSFQEVAGNKFNDTASLISGVSRMTRPGGGRGSIVSTNSNEETSSILPIITKQRDRFRDRNNELEDELKKQYSIISDLKRQVNGLKKDNEELYERTRYLASFKNDASLSTRSNGRKLLQPKPNATTTTTSPNPHGDLENNGNPYQASYESRLHPIEQFRMREQERIHSKLSPLERLFISLTRAILATRGTRMLFVAYCFGLHCLVMFITIYAMGIHTTQIAEVGMNISTGGVASGSAGAPEKLANAIDL